MIVKKLENGRKDGEKKKTSFFVRFFYFKLLINVKKNVIIKWYYNEVILLRGFPLKKKEERQEKVKTNKKESELVTKETLCAVFALFSLLALLVLCTGDLIFGQIGYSICIFLTGLFGYAAYPVLLGAFYLCTTALIGKRLVKNRKAFTCIALTVLSALLIIHTATTFSWELSEYTQKCFAAGESFPAATVCGWVGALLVFVVAAATTKIGALVFFSVLTLFFGYLSYVFIKKSSNAQPQTATQAVQQSTITPVEIPLTGTPAATAAPVQNVIKDEAAATNAFDRETTFNEPVAQRPAFTLSDEPQSQGQAPAQTVKQSGAFSPFATPNANANAQNRPFSYEESRAFLFGSTPAENYQRNLIFDPNARVNKRPPVDPNENSSVQSGYTPSYTDAYQSSVNEEQAVRPQKIFSDRTESAYSTYTPVQPLQEAPITPLQPIRPSPSLLDVETPKEEPTPAVATPTYTRAYEETREETFDEPKTDTYQRHDYMGLFSPANPNVFGDSEEDRRFAEETFDRDSVRSTEELFDRDRETISFEKERNVDDELSSRDRDGLHIFDEEEPYSLRTDFENDRNVLADRSESVRADSLDLLSDREETSNRFSETRLETSNSRFDEPIQKAAEVAPIKKEPAPAPEPTPAPPKPRVIRPYVRVPLDDFDCRDVEPMQNPEEVEETKATILATLEDYKVTGASIASVTFGPTVTRYNVTIPRNIPPKKVVALDQPMAISLYSSGVNIYPNYEDGVVSIEVPNKERQFVQLGCMLTGDTYVNAKSSSIMFTMGKDAGNRKVYGDISKMIHMLVAGSSGSGKSVFLGSLIISLIYKYSPEELRLILIDPKKTEFVLYNNLPHLMINEIITDANKAIQSLNWAIGEMNRRYGLFEQMSRAGTYVVNLDQYNEHLEKAERLPKIVIIIDELADLMLAAKKDIEDRIQNLTQKARAAGIHLVVATQRPSTDVITGVIKSNLPTRIAFAVATDVDSRVILDQTGAQKLLGKGDFLYTMQGINTPVRVQSAFISAEDSQRVVNFIKSNNEAYYDESATAFINNARSGGESSGGGFNGDEIEPVYIDALRYVILSNSASISLIQRKCSIGYNKAGKIVEWMEDMGYISSFEGAKARKVLITKEEFESKYGSL